MNNLNNTLSNKVILNPCKWTNIDLISHNDLDGYSANVLMNVVKHFNPDININIQNISYKDNLFDKISCIIKKKSGISPGNCLIIICDIGCSSQLIFDIEKYMRNYFKCMLEQFNIQLVLCDHHNESSTFLQQPRINDFITTYVGANGHIDGACGSKLLYNYLNDNKLIPPENWLLKDYIQNVDSYDLWTWVNSNPFAEKLNMFFKSIPNTEFVNTITKLLLDESYPNNLKFKDIMMNNNEIKSIIDVVEKDIRNTEKQMNYMAKVSNFNKEYRIAAVICNKHISNVGNYICRNKPDIDFCMILNPMSRCVSFRGVRDDINLGRIANRLFGGGGHKLSAAAYVNNEIMIDLLKNHICIEN